MDILLYTAKITKKSCTEKVFSTSTNPVAVPTLRLSAAKDGARRSAARVAQSTPWLPHSPWSPWQKPGSTAKLGACNSNIGEISKKNNNI